MPRINAVPRRPCRTPTARPFRGFSTRPVVAASGAAQLVGRLRRSVPPQVLPPRRRWGQSGGGGRRFCEKTGVSPDRALALAGVSTRLGEPMTLASCTITCPSARRFAAFSRCTNDDFFDEALPDPATPPPCKRRHAPSRSRSDGDVPPLAEQTIGHALDRPPTRTLDGRTAPGAGVQARRPGIRPGTVHRALQRSL